MNYPIPNELTDAFRLEKTGFSLLIKGNPGTGKTTLALELLASSQYSIYVSTRVTPQALYAQYPWIKDFISADQIIDASSPGSPEPASISPRLRFQNLPDFLQAIHSRIEAMNQSVTLAIDSWDAVTGSQSASLPEKLRWESILTGLVRLGNYNLILVSEGSKPSPLDYLVDGILLLEEDTHENRRIRSVRIKKIRGIESRQQTYLFTLKHGRFQYFSPISLDFRINLEKKAPISDPRPEYISSGCQDFDRILNPGYRRGSLNLFEFGLNLPNKYQFLLRATVFNFLIMDRGVCIVTPPGNDTPTVLEDLYIPIFGEEVLKTKLRVFEDRLPAPEDNESYIVRHPRESLPHYLQDLIKAIRSIRSSEGNPACLWMGLDQIENLFDIETIKANLGPFFAEFKHMGDVGIITVKEWQQITKYVMPMANTYWKIRMLDKVLVIYGIIPPTEPFVVELASNQPYPTVQLVPIN